MLKDYVKQSEAAEVWQPGTVVKRTVLWNGHPLILCPVVVVSDEPDLLVLYTRAGTRNLNGALANRSQMPLSERTKAYVSKEPSVLREWQWKSHVLSLNYPGKRYAVDLFWRPNWEFAGWYVNLQPPYVRRRQGIELGKDENPGDYLLDIRVTADLKWAWKDVDEFEEAVKAGVLHSSQRTAALEAGHAMIAAIEGRAKPFCEPWPQWRPETGWPAPHLTMGADGKHVLLQDLV